MIFNTKNSFLGSFAGCLNCNYQINLMHNCFIQRGLAKKRNEMRLGRKEMRKADNEEQ